MADKKLRKYIKVTIYIGLILATLWLIYKTFVIQSEPVIELFEDLNNSKTYGNLIAYTYGIKNSSVYKDATKQIIRLPGRFKLTGIKVNGVVLTPITVGTSGQRYVFAQEPNTLFTDIDTANIHTITNNSKTYYVFKSKSALEKLFPGDIENISEFTDTDSAATKYFALTKYIEPAFKLALVDNQVDVNSPEKHVDVMINNTADLKLNQDYKDYSYFDNDDNTAKFAGSTLIITQSFADSLVTRPVYITGWEIYGLAPYAPSWADYSVMNKLTSTSVALTSPKTEVPLTTNKKVYYLELISNTPITHTAYNITIQYKNTLDNLTNVYNVNGPVQLGFSNSSKYIFFDEPVIASQLTVTNGFSATPSVSVNVNVYGVNATQKDENTFKLEQGKYDPKGIIVEGQKCPNVGQMMKKQLQAQQICEALEQKDMIRNKKASYERDKAYLKKLAEQDGEIKLLADKITGLIEKKNNRIRESSISGDAQKLDAELEKIQLLRREAEDYIKKPSAAELNVNVNLEPDLDLDYIKKNINV
jgi:hypothetical protein